MKYEEFNLERALAGGHVILRNGTKAYIRHLETELVVKYPLIGFDADGFNRSWDDLGMYTRGTCPNSLDIVGMWPKEPLTMPDSFWDIVGADITSIAKDSNGNWYGYISCKPRSGSVEWIFGVGEYVPLSTFSQELFPDCDWRESLIIRPSI